jgi:enhancing lycopene biosynthesis protein 2
MLSSLSRSIRTFSTVSPKVAVIFSGCGVFDGTEITEGVAALVHLSAKNASVACFAPDVNQMHVIDHLKMEESEGETRNVLVESARICRGNIQSLASLDASQFDALFLPGGFGAAKNLSTFAVDGVDMQVNPEVGSLLRAFKEARKPVGLVCISPVIASKVLPGTRLTLGKDDNEEEWPHREAIDAAR